MRRIAAVLLSMVAVFGVVSVSAPQPAAADGVVSGLCDVGLGPALGAVMHAEGKSASTDTICDAIGTVVKAKVKKEWTDVWNSVLGDVIRSAEDVAKWVLQKVLTVALLGPSLDLSGTGLFGAHATLAGMLTWLGLVIATFGAMWQIGKMAITGQTKHLGRAMLGWVESTILSAVGVGLIALLVTAGDALTDGLVNATFHNGGDAYKRIIAVMIPAGVSNPITMLAVVAVLLLVGFIQLIMVFLRQSAVPIQCLLLPVAGGGRVGGDATRQWAPRLITSICVVISYKPLLAVIICTGFSEFGHAATLAEWLRGCATLILGVLAPGPLTRVFAPFGETVGGGLASGGVGGALTSAAGYFAGSHKGGDDSRGGATPATPVEHARLVEQSMGKQGASGQGGDGRAAEVQAQAARTDASARVPGQATPDAAAATGPGAAPGAGVPAAGAGTGTPGAAGAAAGPAGAGIGVGIQILDGVHRGVQGSSGQIGNSGSNGGGNTQ